VTDFERTPILRRKKSDIKEKASSNKSLEKKEKERYIRSRGGRSPALSPLRRKCQSVHLGFIKEKRAQGGIVEL